MAPGSSLVSRPTGYRSVGSYLFMGRTEDETGPGLELLKFGTQLTELKGNGAEITTEGEPPSRQELQGKKGRNQQDCEPNSCCEAERSHDQAEKDCGSGCVVDAVFVCHRRDSIRY